MAERIIPAINSQPMRSFTTASNRSGWPIRSVIDRGNGTHRPGGKARNAPWMWHGTTGTLVPATKAPMPLLARVIRCKHKRRIGGKFSMPSIRSR